MGSLLKTFLDSNDVKRIVHADKKHLEVFWDAKAVFNTFLAANNKEISFPGYGNRHECYSNNSNADFYGSTIGEFKEAANGKFDASEFTSQQSKYQGLEKLLSEKAEMIAPKRKRKLSEYDGEIDFDRRWDMAPYWNTVKEKSGVAPTLDIWCEFSFNCGVAAEDIAKFGVFCWSIANAVENAGIQVNLNLYNYGERRNSQDHKWTDCNHISVKKAGEYIDMQNIARCFTPGFYRRGMFTACYIASWADQGVPIESDFGRSKERKRDKTTGEICLSINESNRFDPDKTCKDILEALGVTKG